MTKIRGIPRSANPFDEDRLDVSADYRAHWNVPSLNAPASDWLLGLVRDVSAAPDATPARKIAVLLAQSGYGKTHLFGRVADALGQDVVFAFVGPVLEAQLEHPLQHVRWHVVETLFDPPPGEPSWITRLMARLCQASFQSYFDHLPDLLRTRHAPLRQQIADAPLEAAMEVLSPAKDLAPYQQFASSLADAYPALQADVVRALALGWSPAGLEARRWLRGDDLPEPECKRLGLSAESPDAERVIHAVATLLRRIAVPLVICCDQLEAVLKQPDVGPIHFSNGLVGLLPVPNMLIVLGCLEDAWKIVATKHVHQSFIPRTITRTLSLLSEAEAIELVRRRVDDWEGNGVKGGTWPIRPASVTTYIAKSSSAPRALLQSCKSAIDKWLVKEHGEVDLEDGGLVPNLPDAFLRHWNAELDKIRQKAKSPDDVQEAGLFQSVCDAITIAKRAGHLPPGMNLLDVKRNALSNTKTDPRPSLALTLSANGRTFTVIVAVSKRDSGNAFTSYITALNDAVAATDVAGAILVRPFAQLGVGPAAQGRKTYDKLLSSGKLRPFPLEQERLTFDQLECLLTVLTDADDGMPLGGTEIHRDDCERLIAETGLLKRLRLFDFIFENWSKNVPKSPFREGQESPVSNGPSRHPERSEGSGTADQKDVDSSAPPPPATPPAPTPATTPAPPPDSPSDDVATWAQTMLEKVVAKLKIWGLPVRPLGVQVGPTFVRFKVQPEDTTDINKVRNKAQTMQVNLGLPDRPMIGFQPGYLSIDVRRPIRQPVPLAPLLAARPANLANQLAFPAGLDVSGHAHWLNLSDTADCHLLIAGTTGSGKSEFLKVILAALAAGHAPDQLTFILIDPKRVTFNLSGPSPYLRHPIAYEAADALPLIEQCVTEMEARYATLAQRHKSHVSELTGHDAVPRIVLVFDEFADLMADKAAKKELEPLLRRLGAKARAAGIHLILGTQRTEASVVTPLLRSNLPGRISLKVTGEKDSALILDAPGAADLLGKGDLLWRRGGDLLRLQSPLVTNDELEALLRVT